ncbi:hypothetical protein AVEN_125564-1 [Araneus ventricosus]|uniref:DDE-1 domain-containing protein n=1 Tax=Araneus ventricosus TaxID=182803 RepID=A0A4Y2NEE3_ARAVE|nr:hypothetical protein AVEN_125564-1 [Araneus ventricosus]
MENDANPKPALIQPMDQNVIQNIKLGYRRLLLTTILNNPLHNENLEKAQTNKENVQTEEIQLASLINQLQNTNPVSNTEVLQWAAEADDSLTRNKILTDDEIIRTVTAEDDDDDDVTPVNSIKISHSEAGPALNTSLQWAEEQNFEAHGNYAPQTFKRPRI